VPEEDARPLRVLIVDDDPGDVLMIQEALQIRGVAKIVDVVGDGEEAIEFLHRRDRHRDAVRPDVILLDLNMPRMDGREVLAQVKADAGLSAIPIVVLTTSSVDSDIAASYQLHANAYIAKPIDLDDFIDAVRHVDEFFGSVVALPPRD
jgi:CheY-like chemotaxis protein